jgi:hypothetical protein
MNGIAAFFTARARQPTASTAMTTPASQGAAAHNDQLGAHGMSIQARWRHGELLLPEDPGRPTTWGSRQADAERLAHGHLAADINATLAPHPASR